MYSILENCKISTCALKAADNEVLTGSTLDMQGFDSVTFVAAALKGEALDFSIKAQQGAKADMTDAADLAGSSVAFSTTTTIDGMAALEIHQPRERYVRALTTVPDAAAAKPTSIIAIQFNSKNVPLVNIGKLLISPAEGTA